MVKLTNEVNLYSGFCNLSDSIFSLQLYKFVGMANNDVIIAEPLAQLHKQSQSQSQSRQTTPPVATKPMYA